VTIEQRERGINPGKARRKGRMALGQIAPGAKHHDFDDDAAGDAAHRKG